MSDQYGGLPPAPTPPEGWGQPQRGEAPPSVLNAVRLMFISAAIGLVSVIVLFATKDQLKKEILKKTPNASDSTINAALTIGAVVGIVFLVLYVLLAFQVRKGKNWARIVTFIIAGLGVLSALGSLAQAEPAISRVFSLIGGLIDVAIIVFLAQSASSRYFKPAY
jgi:hypothetical protein